MMLNMTFQKAFNSCIVSKDAVNSFKEMFPLARMFPVAVMYRKAGTHLPLHCLQPSILLC